MNGPCVQESLVRRAAVESRWTDALRQHVTGCDDCAAAAETAAFMSSFAEVDERSRALPDPAVIWLKAQILRGGEVPQRALLPLDIAQITSYVVIAAGWAALLTWKWTELERWVMSFTPASLLGDLASTQSSISATVVGAVVVLSSITVLLGVHAILAEE